MPYVYMLRCADGTLYIGHTNDPASRERAHNEGSASAYTAARRPVKTVYLEELKSTTDALARERQLKRWTARKKEALIASDWSILKSLSARRQR